MQSKSPHHHLTQAGSAHLGHCRGLGGNLSLPLCSASPGGNEPSRELNHVPPPHVREHHRLSEARQESQARPRGAVLGSHPAIRWREEFA